MDQTEDQRDHHAMAAGLTPKKIFSGDVGDRRGNGCLHQRTGQLQDLQRAKRQRHAVRQREGGDDAQNGPAAGRHQ